LKRWQREAVTARVAPNAEPAEFKKFLDGD
jgi:hypothetical protein